MRPKLGYVARLTTDVRKIAPCVHHAARGGEDGHRLVRIRVERQRQAGQRVERRDAIPWRSAHEREVAAHVDRAPRHSDCDAIQPV